MTSLSRKARLELGRDARSRLSRSAIGKFDIKQRSFNPINILLNATEGRVPKLLPEKYRRMSASPFAFFRGAVSIMAADLGHAPHTNLFVQLCGDAHVQNLGSFEAPDGRVVFDINDFDETIAGPWEWDVKRMAASLVLAGLESHHSLSECETVVESFVSRYLDFIAELADQPILVAARHQIRRLRKTQGVSAALRQAERAQPCDLLRKYTETSADASVRFRRINSSLWRLTGATRREVLRSMSLYRESLPPERLHLFDFFRPVDMASKIVGTGSVGLRDYVVLMRGNGANDPLFLQVKQEVSSAYAPYLDSQPHGHQGQRVAEGQRKIQPLSDLLLGWTRIGEHDFLVRQLNDHKGSIELDNLRGEGLGQLASVAAELLARGHARSGDPLTIHGYVGNCGKVLQSLVRFATGYAAATKADFEAFTKTIRQKKISPAAA